MLQEVFRISQVPPDVGVAHTPARHDELECNHQHCQDNRKRERNKKPTAKFSQTAYRLSFL